MMELKNLRLAYGKHVVLENESARWDGSQMIMLLGENGTGKSTFLKSILGLKDYEGSLSMNGREIREMKPAERAKSFAYVAQQRPLTVHERAEDFLLTGVAYRLSLFEQPTKADRAKVEEVFSLFHLEHLRGCFMDELSGGEVQMLHVARCFVEEHDMLILDEPCTYLDYHRQYTFLQLVKEMLRKKNMGAVISIHDPNLAILFADYVVFLHENRIFQEKKIQSLRDKREMAEVFNEIYHQAFHITEEKNEIMLQWKTQQKGVPYASGEGICEGEICR